MRGIKYCDGVLWLDNQLRNDPQFTAGLLIGGYIEPTYETVEGLSESEKRTLLEKGVDYTIPADTTLTNSELLYFIKRGTHREDIIRTFKQSQRVSDEVIECCIEYDKSYIEIIKQNRRLDLNTLSYLVKQGIAIDIDYYYKEEIGDFFCPSWCIIDLIEHGVVCEKFLQSGNASVQRKLAEGKFYLSELLNNKKWQVRRAVAEQGYGLDILVNDPSENVRVAVAEQGYGLDVLVNDSSCWVRETVARQGYGLDVLINDFEWRVRQEVAEQGYGLDILVNDKEWRVRKAVARQGYGLDILVNDPSANVRRAVAEQGYGLDVLINDRLVFPYVIKASDDVDVTSSSFMSHDIACVLESNISYVHKYKTLNVGFCEYDIELLVQIVENTWEKYCEELRNDVKPKDSFYPRVLTENKKILNKVQAILVNDGYYAPEFIKSGTEVRVALAVKGQFLPILLNDKNSKVRQAVARQGYGLDILVNDKNESVRKQVAQQGYGLDILVNDKNESVRVAVAEQGYRLEQLLKDDTLLVRELALESLLDKISRGEITLLEGLEEE